jgi:hypothetical protein
MDWLTEIEWVADWQLRLGTVECPTVPGRTPEERARAVAGLERRTSASTDALCRQLARGNPVAATDAERYFLRQRLHQALRFLEAAATPFPVRGAPVLQVPASVDPESRREWLLIALWDSTLRDEWIANPTTSTFD